MNAVRLQNAFPCKILLPEDCGCISPNVNGYCFCIVRTGGDCLKGVVEMVTPGHLDLVVEVRFEGIIIYFHFISYTEFISCRSLSDVDTR